MQLIELGLKSFRGFEQLTTQFSPGINLFSGANGAGKTTVLEAIGFALFDAPIGRGGDDLAAIRAGASELSVRATFEQDGVRYELTRSLNSKGRKAKLKRAKTVTATGNEEVNQAIAGLLRVADRSALPGIFQTLVGITQGGLPRPFLLDADARKTHFNPLLNLDRYELAARRVLDSGARFTAELTALEAERLEHEGELKAYDTLVKRLAECETESVASEKKSGEIQSRLEKLSASATELEKARTTLDGLTLERAVVEEKLKNRDSSERRAHREMDEAETAATIVERTRTAYEEWEELDSECRALEIRRDSHQDVRSEVDSLEKRLLDGRATIDGERTGLDEQIENNKSQTEQLMTERDAVRSHLDTLRERSRRTEGLHAALQVALDRSTQLHQAVAHVDLAEIDSAADEEVKRRAEAARGAERAAAAAAAAATKTELEELSHRASALDRERENLAVAHGKANELAEERTTLAQMIDELRPQHGACPLLKAPCKNIAGKSLVEYFERDLEQLDATRATRQETVRFAEARLAEALDAKKELAKKSRAERQEPAGSTTERAAPSRGRSGGNNATVNFDGLGSHISALAGVLGALEAPSRDEAQDVVALIGAEAGAGDTEPAPQIVLTIPDASAIDEAHTLLTEGRAALRLPESAERTNRVADTSARLTSSLRQLHAAVVESEAQARTLLTLHQKRSRAAENVLLESTKRLEGLALERTQVRGQVKSLSSKDLGLLDTEIALSNLRVKLGGLDRLEGDLKKSQKRRQELEEDHHEYRENALLARRADDYRDEWKQQDRDRLETKAQLARIDIDLAKTREEFDPDALAKVAREREEAHGLLGQARESVRSLAREKTMLAERIAELEGIGRRLKELESHAKRAELALTTVDELATLYREMAGPIAQDVRRQVATEANRLYRLLTRRSARLRWDETFALSLEERSGVRMFSDLAHGEQTTAALAVVLALLRGFPSIGILCLDEPAAHLDPNRRVSLAVALSAYQRGAADYLNQLLIVSHDQSLDMAADRHTALADPA